MPSGIRGREEFGIPSSRIHDSNAASPRRGRTDGERMINVSKVAIRLGSVSLHHAKLRSSSMGGSVFWCAPTVAAHLNASPGPSSQPACYKSFFAPTLVLNPKSEQSKRRDSVLSSLSVIIEGLDLAERLSTITPAKTVCSITNVILTMIRASPPYFVKIHCKLIKCIQDSTADEDEYVDL